MMSTLDPLLSRNRVVQLRAVRFDRKDIVEDRAVIKVAETMRLVNRETAQRKKQTVALRIPF